MLQAPDVPTFVEHSAGILASCILIGGIVVLTRDEQERENERRWRPVFAALVVSAALVGFGFRIFTARVDGANIGGFQFLFVGPAMVSAMLLWAVVRVRKLLRLTIPRMDP